MDTTKETKELLQASVNKTDGFANIYTHEGMPGAAKSTGFTYIRDVILNEQLCRNIYRSDGFGANSRQSRRRYDTRMVRCSW